MAMGVHYLKGQRALTLVNLGVTTRRADYHLYL